MPHVLIAEPHPRLREDLSRALRAAGYEPSGVEGLEEARRWLAGSACDAVVADVRDERDLSEFAALAEGAGPAVCLAVGGRPSVSLAVSFMKAGATDYLQKPFSIGELERALAPVRRAGGTRSEERDAEAFLTQDPVTSSLLADAVAAARTEATILIVGESGTGKDLLARRIHRASARSAGALVAIDCAALPDGVLDSELFGHERGAFTGAEAARVGQVQSAEGGTLLLDEVSEASQPLQAKLLRVLQEREVLPVGAVTPVAADIRIVATTQSDLSERVARGAFREDLLYRLDVIVLRIPPLRERPGDVPLLARRFLERAALATGQPAPILTERAERELSGLELRGNARELENLMRRAAVLAPGRPLDIGRLTRRGPPSGDGAPEVFNLRELERRAIVRCLAATGGNRTRASQALGISVRTLRNKLQVYGLR